MLLTANEWQLELEYVKGLKRGCASVHVWRGWKEARDEVCESRSLATTDVLMHVSSCIKITHHNRVVDAQLLLLWRHSVHVADVLGHMQFLRVKGGNRAQMNKLRQLVWWWFPPLVSRCPMLLMFSDTYSFCKEFETSDHVNKLRVLICCHVSMLLMSSDTCSFCK